jgi:hypothetical protein
MALIDIGEILFNTDHITCVRPSGLDSKHTIIFTIGQSAVDGGFLVHIPYKEVTRRLRESRMSYLLEMTELMDAGYDEDEEVEEESEDSAN